MTDFQQPGAPANLLEEPKKRSETLNVITILTFVGSGIAIISQLYSFFKAQASYDQMVAMQDKMDQMPGFMKGMMGGDPIEMARKALDNRVPLLILVVVAAVLCIYGAMQMRQLKKVGFPIYVIGELLPIPTTMILLGITSGFGLIFSLLIAAVFIILYASQRKYLS
jgi:hypothetical protein